MFSLSDLNPQQRVAAERIHGPVLILAGAGSGKTKTITYRMANMIRNHHIPGDQILAVSFTNKAATEMKERLQRLLGKRMRKGPTLCTFHALGAQILRQEIHELGYNKQFNIYDTADQIAIIREGTQFIKDEKTFDRKRILAKIGFLKNRGIDPTEFPTTAFFDPENEYDVYTESVYHFYQEKLKFYNSIDFDDLIYLTVKLFKLRPDLAKKYSELYQYILVDEYQDTNPLQFELILHLTQTHQNLCVVGDDDQSIYAFRGADVTNILQFEKNFNETLVIKLEENYRSTPNILNLANEIIKENTQRYPKALWTQNAENEIPLLWACSDDDHEAEVIATEVKRLNQTQKIPLSSMAVLYRSNTQPGPLEDALRLYQIPYTMIGGQKFYEKKEIKDLIAYLGLIHNNRDELSLRRILNIPSRGIGIKTLERYLELSKRYQIPLFDTFAAYGDGDQQKREVIQGFISLIRKFREIFKTEPLTDAIKKLIAAINFTEHIEKSYEGTNQQLRRKKDLELFVLSSERFLKYYQGETPFRDFLERILLQDSQDRQEKQENEKDKEEKDENDELTLMTLHSSKGLEFDMVFLMGVEEELMPHKKALIEGNIQEERRLCYVGVTRAKKKLMMTYCKERTMYGKKIQRHMSRFVMPLPHLYQEYDRNNFAHLNVEEKHEMQNNFFGQLQSLLDD